jgi:hypothetical protein
VRPHEKVKRQLIRFETVEWRYDGLKGKIIPWTKEHGGTSDDPSVQAFVVARNGQVLSRCPGGSTYAGASFARWLNGQADDYDRKFPRTKVPFAVAEIFIEEGEPARCEAFAEAREGRKPVLLYIGREPQPEDDKKAKKEVKASRKLEKGALGSKKAAEAAKGWVLLRLDLSRPDHLAFVKEIGVAQAPALLMFPPGETGPVDLGTKLTGPSLAYLLKKQTK